jgi:hypothetical protein
MVLGHGRHFRAAEFVGDDDAKQIGVPAAYACAAKTRPMDLTRGGPPGARWRAGATVALKVRVPPPSWSALSCSDVFPINESYRGASYDVIPLHRYPGVGRVWTMETLSTASRSPTQLVNKGILHHLNRILVGETEPQGKRTWSQSPT